MIPDWLAGASSGSPCSCCRPGVVRRAYFERTLAGIRGFFENLLVFEESARRPGLFQRLDPRVKWLTVLSAIVMTTTTAQLHMVLWLYSATILLALLSRLSIGPFLLRTWVFIPLFTGVMALPALLNVVTPGEPLWILWRSPLIMVTRQGAASALLLVLRVATTISWTLLLLLTTRWNVLLEALQLLRVPRTFTMTLGMMVNYLQLFLRQAEEIHLAMKSRAIHPLRARTGQHWIAAALGALWDRSLYTAREVHMAMVARGYAGEIHTLEGKHRLTLWDGVWGALWAAGLVFFWRFRNA